MKISSTHILAPFLILSAFLVMILITIPGTREWESSVTSVSLTIPGSAASSTSSSESSSESSVSSGTSSASSAIASVSSSSPITANPSGQYRHHETRIQEMILSLIREGLFRGHVVQPSHSSATSSSAPTYGFPAQVGSENVASLEFFGAIFGTHMLAGWGDGLQTFFSFSLPEFQSKFLPQASQTMHAAAGTEVPLKTWTDAEDLNPGAYGWISSQNEPQESWIWKMLGNVLHPAEPASGFEWLLWIVLLALLVLGVRLGLRVNDALTDMLLKLSESSNMTLEQKAKK